MTEWLELESSNIDIEDITIINQKNVPLQPTNSDICQKTTIFFHIALKPKRAKLVWTFVNRIVV